ncbi:hypothetical protein PJL18_03792 [Paenarthrobacter nicotinovorans]|nr:hypothetical protein [Paenarthrobacter nicotinovorans]
MPAAQLAVFVPGVGDHHKDGPYNTEHHQRERDPRDKPQQAEGRQDDCSQGPHNEKATSHDAANENRPSTRCVAVRVGAADAHELVADGVARLCLHPQQNERVDHGDCEADAAKKNQQAGVVDNKAVPARLGDAGDADGKCRGQDGDGTQPVQGCRAHPFPGGSGYEVELGGHGGPSPWPLQSVRFGTCPRKHRRYWRRHYGDTTGIGHALPGGGLQGRPLGMVDVAFFTGAPVVQRRSALVAERRPRTDSVTAGRAQFNVTAHPWCPS